MMTPNCTVQRRLSFMCLTKNKINRVFIDKNLRLFLGWINIFQQVKKVILLRGAMMSKGWGRLGCTAEKSKQNKTKKTCIKLKNKKQTYIGINTADSRVESHAESSVLLEWLRMLCKFFLFTRIVILFPWPFLMHLWKQCLRVTKLFSFPPQPL